MATCGKERIENALLDRTRRVVGVAVERILRLRIMEFRRRAHQDAMEAVRALAAVGRNHHAHCERRAIDRRFQ